MAKKSFKDKIVWITGASSGIGEGLLYEFDKIGAKVIISSRKKEKLEEVKEKCINKDNIFILPLDLGDHDSLAEKVKLAYGFSKNIDLLINNGGISQRDLAMNSSIEVDKRLMNINYFGTVILSKLVIPKMIENKSGQISTVSSLVGKFGTPYRSGYSASKHALHGFFDSLRAEVNEYNIHINITCPGFVHTNVSLNALVGDGKECGEMDQAQVNGMSPAAFAKKMIKALSNKEDEVYIGGKEVVGVYLKRYLPAIFNKLILKTKVR